MGSEAKPPRLAKSLNPNAEEFGPPNAKPFSGHPKKVEQIPGEQAQPLLHMVPTMLPQKVGYFSVSRHGEAVFPPHFIWIVAEYVARPTSYQLSPGSGFYDRSLHDRKASKAEERTVEQRLGRMCMRRPRMVDSVPKRVQTKWRVKGENRKSTGDTVARPIIPFPETLDEVESYGITTAMIRNVPNQFRLEDLLKILDDHCYKENLSAEVDAWSKYDFVYLPMDYRKHAYERRLTNLGYAFVNFTTSKAAFKFCREYHGYKWQVTENRKICQIARADFQGKEELKRKLHKVFRCHCCKFLPVEFFPPRDGLNRRTEGSLVGKYLRGLPRTRLGS